MKETPFFFPNGSYNLFGILHEPEIEPNGEGFVFCHPFAEEKLWSHRVFVNFARELAKIGYTVLRFDYMGHGDSDGKFEESTIETRVSDIKCASRLLKEKMSGQGKINLLGLRLGATLATLVSEEEESIDKLILWDPIINGSTYMKQMLRINISTQSTVYKEVRYNTEALIQQMKDGTTVNIDGYEISWTFFDQAQKIDLLRPKKVFEGISLIVQISKKNGQINNNFVNLSKMYSGCDLKLAVEEPFWKEIRSYYYKANNLFLITINWLRVV
jgi:exosortase A-associated hydrolase 2